MNNTIFKLNAEKELTKGLKDIKQAQEFVCNIVIESEKENSVINLLNNLLIEKEIKLVDDYKATIII